MIGRSSSSSSSSSSLVSGKSHRSRVPVRKDSLTKPPKPLKTDASSNQSDTIDSQQSRDELSMINLPGSKRNDSVESRLYRIVGRSTSNLRRSPPNGSIDRFSSRPTFDRSKSYLTSSQSPDLYSNKSHRTPYNAPNCASRRVNNGTSNNEPRSFMRQTSSSAAKSQKTLNHARFRF